MATVIGEVLGISEGKPGQSFAVTRLPMLPLQPGETLEVEREDNTGWDPWQQVEDFSNSGPDDKHFVADPVSGEIMLGPVVRSVTGVERHFGAVPPAGMHLRLTRYRTGGGPEGNLGRNTLVALKSSIPYIDSVTNRRVASGGVDPESIGSAKIRGPQILRTRNRAVTEEDFEFLAREASPSVVRARCVQPTEVGTEGDPLPGVVRVLVVPTLPSGTDRTIMPDDIRPPTELLQQVREYLDERRLLTTVLTVSQPEYVWVSVEAVVKARNGTNHDRVREAVESRLYSFIHPIHGGTDGDGWPFGRNLFASELYSQLQPVSGVEYIQEIRVFPVDPVTGLRGDAVQTLEINRAGILCSYEHRVTIT
jgi:predicted phage baseplate assembly protein